MLSYVTYAPDGALTGGYLQELQPKHVDCYIEVTPEQRMGWTSYRANAARNSVELIAVPAPDPGPTIPSSVPMRSWRLALHNAGQLPGVLAAVGSDMLLKIDWETLATVQRGGALTTGVGLSAAQQDAALIAAAEIQ